MTFFKYAIAGSIAISISACSISEPPVLPAKDQQVKTQPNIIFIFSDDLSYRDLSAYGQTNFSTPHLDQLSSQSVRFSQAYAGAPECAPSRGTLLTGMSVDKQPIRLNSSARGFEVLPDNLYTFPKMLQQAGYITGVVGKWGLGYIDTTGNPLKQGFDYHYGYLTHYEAHSYFPLRLYENNEIIEFQANDDFDLYTLYGQDRRKKEQQFEDYYDDEGKLIKVDLTQATYAPDLFDRKAIEFIEHNKAQPFLLYFASNLPHGPTITDDFRQLKDRHDMSTYAREWGAMVQRLDISVGRIIETLKDNNLYDNSLIVFASDNGYSMHTPSQLEDGTRVWLEDEFLQNKGQLRGGKFGVLEAGMRIPMFMKLPNQEKAQVISQPVWLPDLFPTFADIASQPLAQKVEGYSLLPLIDSKPNAIPNQRPMYFYKNNEQAVRMGPWYAFRPHPNTPIQLYLIEDDAMLQADVAALYPSVIAQVKHIFNSHEPSEWFWNPGDTAADFKRKVQRAADEGQFIKKYYPNHIELMPWEKK
ncbi:sulfatase-like hydrolase/transferase [Echinimonas agarilytica]|uniref:Sulfatase-like hydrolase/transferase n=1 Tax=Echinimonas agarilytica TaxID=1215918 RepID=A0AA42B811_9GAMM|nr:sulfatase-like hydrolase/transferase [Echinimonas agarilytica]MCM2680349.1 sulfatase-like hydrolase/transferase [Echinimonas agarilytica]